MQKSKMAVWRGLKITVKRREVKSKGENERYKHLNAEFQRIARRDKKAFLSDQCKEIDESNRTGHGTTDWFQIGKGVCQDCILSPAYLIYMQSTSCEMPGWMKHKVE